MKKFLTFVFLAFFGVTIANADFPIFGYDKGDYVKI